MAVRSAGLDDLLTTDAVVIAGGRGSGPETRLDLLKDNARTIRDLASRLRGYPGLVVVVTNPVDVLTYEFAVSSALPHERVLGTGTMLDTARLRQMVGRTLRVAPQQPPSCAPSSATKIAY